jgi:hypothetical protein
MWRANVTSCCDLLRSNFPENSQREAATLAKRRRWPNPPPGHRGAFAFVILTLQDREVARNHVAYVSSCISSAKLEGVGTGPHTVLLGRLTGRESRVGDTWSLQTALEGTGFISREPKGNALGLDCGPFLGAVGYSSDRRRRVGGRRGRGYWCSPWQILRRILGFLFFRLVTFAVCYCLPVTVVGLCCWLPVIVVGLCRWLPLTTITAPAKRRNSEEDCRSCQKKRHLNSGRSKATHELPPFPSAAFVSTAGPPLP